jgi:hypothetical protein
VSRLPFPTQVQAREWHEQLVGGDPVAPGRIFVAFLAPLTAHLDGRFRSHRSEEAAHQALADYVCRPAAFDASRGNLVAYLKRAAECDLKSMWQRDAKKNAGRVELRLYEEKSSQDEPIDELIREEDELANAEVITRVRAGLTDAEARVLDLLVAGERDGRLFAEALGVAGRPDADRLV